jgi:hypothetical protein
MGVPNSLRDAGSRQRSAKLCNRLVFGRLDMLSTCKYVLHMSKMIQLRNVPDELHRKLKARAAQAGMSLSDYLVQEIRLTAERPTAGEFKERLSRRAPVVSGIDPAGDVRAEREGR